eukprot:UN30912
MTVNVNMLPTGNSDSSLLSSRHQNGGAREGDSIGPLPGFDPRFNNPQYILDSNENRKRRSSNPVPSTTLSIKPQYQNEPEQRRGSSPAIPSRPPPKKPKSILKKPKYTNQMNPFDGRNRRIYR